MLLLVLCAVSPVRDPFRSVSVPTLGFFHSGERDAAYHNGMRIIARLAHHFDASALGLVTVNCSATQLCEKRLVEPLPAFQLFVPNAPRALEFTNEQQLFPVLEFIEDNAGVGAAAAAHPLPAADVAAIGAANYSAFLGGSGCAVVLYALRERDRMSELLRPTFAELSSLFAGDRRVRFGAVDCSADRALCLRLGVRAAPLVVAYRGGALRAHRGVRELPQLLRFVNAQCGASARIDDAADVRLAREFASCAGDAAAQQRVIASARAAGASPTCVRLMERYARGGASAADDAARAARVLAALPRDEGSGGPRERVAAALRLIGEFGGQKQFTSERWAAYP